MVPVCPGHRPAQNVYVYWFFSCPTERGACSGVGRRGWQRGLAKGWHRVGEGLAGFLAPSNFAIPEVPVYRRRTNVQQLTCKIDLSNYFYYLFFSFVLIELKPFVLKGKVLGENL